MTRIMSGSKLVIMTTAMIMEIICVRRTCIKVIIP